MSMYIKSQSEVHNFIHLATRNFRKHFYTEAAIQRCYWEKEFWKYAANLQENTHAEV